MAEVVAVIQALASVVAVWFAYKTVRLAHQKMTADEKAAVSAIEHNEAQARKSAILTSLSLYQKILMKGMPFYQFLIKSNLLPLIRLGAFDEDVYKELSCNSVIKTWESANGFVEALRKDTNVPTLFQDLERLANKWKADPIKLL